MKLAKLVKIAICTLIIVVALIALIGGRATCDALGQIVVHHPTFEVRHTETLKVDGTKVTMAIVRDAERGVGTEYIVILTGKGGVTITPRINPDGSPLTTSTVTANKE